MIDYMKQDGIRTVLVVLLVLGVLATGFGIFRIVTTSIEIENNPAHQIKMNEETVDPQSTAEGRGLVMADLERRELLQTRSESMVMAGVGLVLIAVGWMGMDFYRSFRKRKGETTSEIPESVIAT